MTRTALPRLARLLLRLTPLASRRAEVESDLLELFERRIERRGRAYAARRCCADVLSLWIVMSPATSTSRHISKEREGMLRGVATDVVHAMRLFRRTPAVVLVAIIGLGLAIGVSTAVATVLNIAVFRPTGIDDPASTVRVMRAYKDGMGTSWRYREFLQLRDGAPSVPIDAWLLENVALSTTPAQDSTPPLPVLFVTGDYLQRLTRRTAAGRSLTASDDRPGADPVVVVSYMMWERLLSADPAAVGRTLWLNGTPHTIVGVASRGFVGATESNPALWIPIASHHSVTGNLPIEQQTAINISIVAHLPAGTTKPQVQAVLSASAAQIATTGPAAGEEPLTGVRLMGLGEPVNSTEASFVFLVIAIVATVVGLVLLLACINVANLLLAGAIARRRELGVRLAIGASRWRVVRQLTTESLLIALAGGASGLILATWLVPVIAHLTDAPLLVDLSMDSGIFALLAFITTAAGLVTGVLPARFVLRDDVAAPLRGGASTSDGASVRPARSRSLFIGFQAAASLLLLIIAALLGRAMVRATQVQVGFDVDRIVTIAPSLGQGSYDAAGANAYFAAALERVRAIPGVESAAITAATPFDSGSRVTIFRRNGSRYTVYHNDTRADYFSTIGLRIVRGRPYTDAEVAGNVAVAVISNKLARDFFRDEDPIGQPLSRIIEGSKAVVVGVVSDSVTARLGELSSPTIYQPLGDTSDARIVVRSQGSPDELVRAIRSALVAIDPRVRLDIGLAREGLRRQVAEPQALATLAGALAILALTLAVVGLYGVTTFAVGQRTQEISVRMALGATSRDILRLLVSDSMRPVVGGLVAGVISAFAAGRILAGALFGVPSTDPLAFGVGFTILTVAATLAVVIPTRRASSIDPALSLRQL